MNAQPPASAAEAARQGRALAVLLVSTHPERVARWKAFLSGERFDVRERAAEFSADGPPQVIVTDEPLTAAALSGFHELLIRGEIAVVLVGRDLPADVVLPADMTRRELPLVCRLLGQIVTLRRQGNRLAHLAATDPLTELPNRRALEETLQRWQRQPLGPGQVLVFALLDLDQFKQVNTQFGHLEGDAVLRQVGQSLQQGGSQQIGRLGGDEFFLLASAASPEDALALVEHYRRAIGMAATLATSQPLSCSAGVVCASSPVPLGELIAAADRGLRRAKNSGGKRSEVETLR